MTICHYTSMAYKMCHIDRRNQIHHARTLHRAPSEAKFQDIAKPLNASAVRHPVLKPVKVGPKRIFGTVAFGLNK
jgi:hypothetical protein